MSAPKSVVKISGRGVKYESSVDKCEYYIYELARAGLRDVAKFVKRKFKDSYYSHFHRITGNVGRSTKYKVYSGKSTTAPRVEIGLPNDAPGFYGYFQEVGTSKQPKLGLLTHAVEDNIAEIIKIESQYLSGLEDEATAMALVESEDDYDDED